MYRGIYCVLISSQTYMVKSQKNTIIHLTSYIIIWSRDFKASYFRYLKKKNVLNQLTYQCWCVLKRLESFSGEKKRG